MQPILLVTLPHTTHSKGPASKRSDGEKRKADEEGKGQERHFQGLSAGAERLETCHEPPPFALSPD